MMDNIIPMDLVPAGCNLEVEAPFSHGRIWVAKLTGLREDVALVMACGRSPREAVFSALDSWQRRQP